MECRQPETIKPVSSRFFIVLEETFAAFQRLVPHMPDTCIMYAEMYNTLNITYACA